ncbi:MAG: haloacid dehalogenase type II [Gammaproteobacteria bacterium]|nr:MAG: haloacid dehalogenase type II [Gammaproteobacteria bacterium]
MAITLAFDVYGTLIDTHGILDQLQGMVGDDARRFSQDWRNKQLEYSFRRGLMQNYEDFSVCTSQALDYTCGLYEEPLSDMQKSELLLNYRSLPAFDDVTEALNRLVEVDCRLFAFSNGTEETVTGLLESAGIRDFFLGVVSVDDLKTFKPNPAAYAHFLRQSGAQGHSAWLVSSNPFDVIGAISAGMSSVWVRRTKEALFDTWGIQPTLTVESLTELPEQLGK